MEFPNYNDFDFSFYKTKYKDLNIFNTDKQLYLHWYNFGCHEGRVIKRLNGTQIQYVFPENFKKPKIIDILKTTPVPNSVPASRFFKTTLGPSLKSIPNSTLKPDLKPALNSTLKPALNSTLNSTLKPTLKTLKPLLSLNNKVAVLLYIFNHKLIYYYVNLLKRFGVKYNNFHVHIAFVGEIDISKYFMEFNNVNIYKVENKGGDIGGFLLLCDKIADMNYKYIIFAHTKTNNNWRHQLCNPIFNFDYHTILDKNITMIASKKWVMEFKDDGKTRYNTHLNYLYDLYNVDVKLPLKWKFVGGTIMALSFDVIKIIKDNQLNVLYEKLNYNNSVDNQWLNEIKRLHLDNKNCYNDYNYRKIYNKPLLSDCMIEHTFERFIGFIVCHLTKNEGEGKCHILELI